MCLPSLGECCGECHRCSPSDGVLASAIEKLEATGFRDLIEDEQRACVWAVRAQRTDRVAGAMRTSVAAAADEPDHQPDQTDQDGELDQEQEQLTGSDAADGVGVHGPEATR